MQDRPPSLQDYAQRARSRDSRGQDPVERYFSLPEKLHRRRIPRRVCLGLLLHLARDGQRAPTLCCFIAALPRRLQKLRTKP